ncbi:MAG: contractile injection system protein, VgrG/Pvc8 family, partial [Reinekea sp.]
MGIDDYAFDMADLPEREYCVQYSESDLAFLQRLIAEEGIFYGFEHEEGKHTVVFSDDIKQLTKLKEALPYNATPRGVAPTPFINTWKYHSRVEASSVKLNDYSFKNPA